MDQSAQLVWQSRLRQHPLRWPSVAGMEAAADVAEVVVSTAAAFMVEALAEADFAAADFAAALASRAAVIEAADSAEVTAATVVATVVVTAMVDTATTTDQAS
jgi:hypothetical protein